MSVRRLTLLIAVLGGLFVAGVALAVAGLLAWGDPGVVVVCLVAALAGAVAATLAWVAVRAVVDGEEDEPASAPAKAAAALVSPVRRPLRIQSLPVADLPAPYVAAVTKALQASRHATGGREQP